MKNSTDEMWDGFIAYVQSYDNPFIGSCAKKRLIIDCDTSLLTVKAQKAIKLSKAVYIQDLSTKKLCSIKGIGMVVAIEIMSWAKFQLTKRPGE